MDLPPINVDHCALCDAELLPWRDLVSLICESCEAEKIRNPYSHSNEIVPNAAGLNRSVIVRVAK